MTQARNAEDARFIGSYETSGRSLSRLVVCVGGLSGGSEDSS